MKYHTKKELNNSDDVVHSTRRGEIYCNNGLYWCVQWHLNLAGKILNCINVLGGRNRMDMDR